MYGLEKGKKGPQRFMFDLEVEIKDKPSRGKELVENTEKRIHELKKALREGANEKEFDRMGILLHAYTALQRVLKRAMK